jgi:hypothetical protein
MAIAAGVIRASEPPWANATGNNESPNIMYPMWAMLEYAMTRLISVATRDNSEPKNAVNMAITAKPWRNMVAKSTLTAGNTIPKDNLIIA